MFTKLSCPMCGSQVRIEAQAGIQKGNCPGCGMTQRLTFVEEPVVEKPVEPEPAKEPDKPTEGESISQHYGSGKPRPFVLGDKRTAR